MIVENILLLASRFLKENLNKEIQIKKVLENNNFNVTYVLPGRRINKNGFTDDIKKYSIYKDNSALYIEDLSQIYSLINKHDAVLLGSWKEYEQIVEYSKKGVKPTINFNSTGGLDHWLHGEDIYCVKSEFVKKHLIFKYNLDNNYKNIVVTGSTMYDGINNSYDLKIRNDLYKRYNLSENKPLAVFFPKAIEGMRKKVRIWFKDWDEKECQLYNNKLEELYQNIIIKTKNSGYNLIVKMHPTAYTSYMTNSKFEKDYWENNNNVKTLKVEDTINCLQILDVGLGVNSHSALDVGFFNKPFIYIDSNKFRTPKDINLQQFCTIPVGPSSHWDRRPLVDVNPWFPSWCGYFSKIDNLEKLLNDIKENKIKINKTHVEMFNSEFWHKNDGRSSNRISKVAMKLFSDYESIPGYKYTFRKLLNRII